MKRLKEKIKSQTSSSKFQGVIIQNMFEIFKHKLKVPILGAWGLGLETWNFFFHQPFRLLIFSFLTLSLFSCSRSLYTETGVASWYGDDFHGKKTANGEIFNKRKLTAAHKTLNFNCLVKVTNLENGKNIVVRINDRGPFVKGRIIDLSKKAAKKIGLIKSGTARVKIEVVGNYKKGK